MLWGRASDVALGNLDGGQSRAGSNVGAELCEQRNGN